MKNRSKDLRNLFRESLKCVSKPISNGSCRIYFYEWSNVNNVPKMFFTFNSFDMFLRDCGIYLYSYQRDLFKDSSTVYCTCYNGTKELNIKGSYVKLCESMKEHERIKNEIKGMSSSPTHSIGGVINRPHMIFEESCRDNYYFD